MRQKDLFTWAQMVSGDSQLKHNFGTKAYGPFGGGVCSAGWGSNSSLEASYLSACDPSFMILHPTTITTT